MRNNNESEWGKERNFNMNIKSPWLQILLILVGGWIIKMFLSNFGGWAIWGIGLIAWLYFNFIEKRVNQGSFNQVIPSFMGGEVDEGKLRK